MVLLVPAERTLVDTRISVQAGPVTVASDIPVPAEDVGPFDCLEVPFVTGGENGLTVFESVVTTRGKRVAPPGTYEADGGCGVATAAHPKGERTASVVRAPAAGFAPQEPRRGGEFCQGPEWVQPRCVAVASLGVLFILDSPEAIVGLGLFVFPLVPSRLVHKGSDVVVLPQPDVQFEDSREVLHCVYPAL
jgi:hypothetical protein